MSEIRVQAKGGIARLDADVEKLYEGGSLYQQGIDTKVMGMGVCTSELAVSIAKLKVDVRMGVREGDLKGIVAGEQLQQVEERMGRISVHAMAFENRERGVISRPS